MEGALLDLARRFTLLARELGPQLTERLDSAPISNQLGQLSRQLGGLLEILPTVDTSAHRYKLSRSLCERLQSRLAPLIETHSRQEVIDEAALLEACLASDGFRAVFQELEAELSALTDGPAAAEFQQTVAGAIEGARSQPSSRASSASDGDGMGDLLLGLGLDDDLPPFAALGEILQGLQCGDMEASWAQLQRCSAADLIECDQWPAVPQALLSLLLWPAAAEEMRLACVELHSAIFREGGSTHKGSVVLNLAQWVVEVQPPLAAVRASCAWTAALHLLASARADICADSLPIPAATRDPLAYHSCGLATLLGSTEEPGIAHFLAAADPSARSGGQAPLSHCDSPRCLVVSISRQSRERVATTTMARCRPPPLPHAPKLRIPSSYARPVFPHLRCPPAQRRAHSALLPATTDGSHERSLVAAGDLRSGTTCAAAASSNKSPPPPHRRCRPTSTRDPSIARNPPRPSRLPRSCGLQRRSTTSALPQLRWPTSAPPSAGLPRLSPHSPPTSRRRWCPRRSWEERTSMRRGR